MTCSRLWLTAFSLFTIAFAGCTHDEDLGGRNGAAGGSANTTGGAAEVIGYCEASPDHRLNWKYDSLDGSSNYEWISAPGQCAELARCLDGPRLDPGVVAHAVDCLSRDVDKLKDKACKEDNVRHATATRATVTETQTACTTKVGECNFKSSYCTPTAVLNDAALEGVRSCLDKPCSALTDCIDALLEEANDCIDDLF
jgi:hypothetical protein